MSEIAGLHAALATLEAQRGVLGDATVDAASAAMRERLRALTDAADPTQGEWKQVTILFADISGFTGLSEVSSAEEVRNIVNACFDRMGEVVTRYGGYIDKFIGDEMMVLFGAPRALEDHASRALYTALEMRDALARFNRESESLQDRPLAVHFGVNSGLIVAGAIGTQARRDYTVMGDAVNVAARLVAQATAGEILVGESTRHLGGHDFEFEPLGQVELAGHGPVEVNRLVRANHRVPLRGGASTRVEMLGRSAELATLRDAFGEVVAGGRPRSVAVIGPPGIGKSRLQLEFTAWLQMSAPSAAVLRGACFAHASATPYSLLADIIGNWLGVSRLDSAAAIAERLATALTRAGLTDTATLHALGAVMAVESSEEQLRDLLPEERRGRIFTAFLALCERLAERGPVVLVMEDLHWGDALSLDLLELLPTLEAPLLLVGVSRPVSDPAAEARQIESRLANARYLRLPLEELDETAAVELVTALAPGLSRSSQVVAAVVEKGQGNPFFIEAIVRALFEQGILVQDDEGMTSQRQHATVSVPDTVWGVLAERLDRLPGTERRVVQAAAVVGPVFWEGLVGELAECEAAPPLDTLHQREFVDFQGQATFEADWEWRFRHIMVRDMAYNSLLAETRRATHLQVARWLERRAGDRFGEYLTLLAHHYYRGETWDRAARFAELSGDRASDLFAYGDARTWYLQALDSLSHLNGGTDKQRRQVDLTLKLAAASFYTPTEEIYRTLETADASAAELGDTESHLKLLVGMASWQFMAGQGSAAIGTSTRAVAEATEAGLEHLLSVPHSLLGKGLYLIGSYEKSLVALEQSRALTEAAGDDPLARYHLVPTLGYLGNVYEVAGRLDEAAVTQAECLRVAEQRHDLRQIGAAHIYYAANATLQGNLSKAFDHLVVAAEILEDRGDPVALYCTLGFLGCVHAQRNETGAARALLQRALAIAGEVKSAIYVPLFRAYLADVAIREDRPAEAFPILEEALELAAKTQQRTSEAEARRVLGWAFYFAHGDSEQAERELRAAVQIHRECGAVVQLSRSLFDLASFLDQVGDADGAAEARAEASALAAEFGVNWLPLADGAPAPGSSQVQARPVA